MDDDPPDLALRRFVVQDAEWADWLANFPLLPAPGDWHVDYFLNRTGPFLRRMPLVERLSAQEKGELRTLLARYAGRIVRYQQRSNWRGKIDWFLTLGSAVAGVWEPIFFSATIVTLLRNGRADSAWAMRKAALTSLANYIEKLL